MSTATQGIPTLQRIRAAALITLSLSATAALSACTFTLYLSKASVEEAITKGYEEQTQIKLSSINCPEEMEAIAGKVYECTAKAPDLNLTFAVKPTGESTNINWETSQIAIAGTTVEKQLKDGIEKEIDVALDSISCPSQIIAEADQMYRCTVTAGDEKATVVVEPTGKATDFNWKLEQSS